MAEFNLLCLKCRATGHIVANCPLSTWRPEFEWMFSDTRRNMDFRSAWSTVDQNICTRCARLDLLGMLDKYSPWHTQSQQHNAVSSRDPNVCRLGVTGSIEFRSNCSVCCCLFALTPNPNSNEQEVLLLPDWTICRVSGEGGVLMKTEAQRKYSSCLLVTLEPSSVSLSFAIRAHRGDAVCLLQENTLTPRSLGGKKIVQGRMNTEVVREWLQRCTNLHGHDCAPVHTNELDQIRLIDVRSRQIVPYPGHECEYVALSYVWGQTAQKRFRVGDNVDEVPSTIEDAISFTIALGQSYLWTDFTCIEQTNEKDKIHQIDRMWSIYRGAALTVIALSGTDADAGLAGFSRSKAFSQLTCCIKGRRLVGTMPTLSQQTWVCPWSHRALTLQEAILSPRCLYISDHQMYFDCTAMLCCESLDHRSSFAHNLTQASNPTSVGFTTWMMDQIGAGGYRNALDDSTKRLQHWGMKLNLYSYRDMTESTDALNAFRGILQRLETMYPKGFFYGLPIEDFDWGLVWRSQWPPTRRSGFPTWTFAGWKGGLWYGQPRDVTQTRSFPTHLKVYRSTNGQLEPIFQTNQPPLLMIPAIRTRRKTDPIYLTVQGPQDKFSVHHRLCEIMESSGVLLIDAVCFRFRPDFSRPQYNVKTTGQFESFNFEIRGIGCSINIISVDRAISRSGVADDTFVLIARDFYAGLVIHHLLMVGFSGEQDGLAYRITVLDLRIPLDDLEILQDLKPRRRWILLS